MKRNRFSFTPKLLANSLLAVLTVQPPPSCWC